MSLLNYGQERLTLFEPLLKQKDSLLLGKPWTLDPQKIRFKLGESITELKVPYHMGIEDEELIEETLQGIVSLLKERYEHTGGTKEQEKKHSFSDFTKKPSSALTEKTYRTDMMPKDSLEKALIEEMLSSVPLMDSALLKYWLRPKGSGRKFLTWSTELLEKALREEAKSEEGEMTSYLALLAITKTIRKKKELIKNLWIKGVSYERLDLATGFMLHLTMRIALRSLFDKTKHTEAIYTNPMTETVLSSAIIPQSFLMIPSNLLSSSLNPFAIRSETAEALKSHLPDPSEWPDNFDSLVASTTASICKDSEALASVAIQYFSVTLREHIITYLMDFDIPGSESHELFYNLYKEDRQPHLRDPKTIEMLESSIDELKRMNAKDTARVERLKSFKAFLSDLKSTILKGSSNAAKHREIVQPVVANYIAYVLDSNMEKFLGLAKGTMVDRRDKCGADILMDEFNKGRLYRFSTDNRSVLKSLAVKKEGQLMVDMKDFTKKTLKLKEIAMSEFMKENFYEPILAAAACYTSGAGLVTKEGGISLKSLPGDAAIFSGGVANLVALAKDIQGVVGKYRDEIKKRFLPKLDTHIETLQKKYKTEKRRIMEEIEEMEAGESTEALENALIALKDEEDMLKEISREELEEAITEEMEAGLFISYGVQAETMVIEPTEEFSNTLKVAIGEKINEASRGTTRNQAIMARLEAFSANIRKSKKNKNLKYPFDIYIDSVYTIRIPQDMEVKVKADLSDRKMADDSKIISRISDEYLNDLEKLRLDMPLDSLKVLTITNDIYNRGQALSEEAFNAYIKETKGVKYFFRRSIPVKNLHEEIIKAFFFTDDPLDLWFGVEKKKGIEKVDIYRRAGELVFKGFESATPTVVYEIVDTDGDFYKGIINHHLKGWYEEEKTRAEGEFSKSLTE